MSRKVYIKEIPEDGKTQIKDDRDAKKGDLDKENGRGSNSKITEANAGDTIVWSVNDPNDPDSGIYEILAVFPDKEDGKIFGGQAAKRKDDEFYIEIPENIKKYREKYYIVYKSAERNTQPVIIDPTVKVPTG